MKSQVGKTKPRTVSSLTVGSVGSAFAAGRAVKCGLIRVRTWYHRIRKDIRLRNPRVPRHPTGKTVNGLCDLIVHCSEEEIQNMENDNTENELRELAAKH